MYGSLELKLHVLNLDISCFSRSSAACWIPVAWQGTLLYLVYVGDFGQSYSYGRTIARTGKAVTTCKSEFFLNVLLDQKNVELFF